MSLHNLIPALETERLILRAPRESDLDREVLFYSGDHAQFVGGPRDRYDCYMGLMSRLGHWVEKGFGFWHLDEKTTGRHVGRVGLIEPLGWPEPEIGWSIMPDALRQGFATEAARAARHYAYDSLGWRTAISLVDPENTASVGVAKKLGAQFEQTFEHMKFGTMHIWRHPGPEARV